MAKAALARISDEDPPESASDWLSEIDGALKREESWRKKAKKVVQRYRDERAETASGTRVNILWSNTEVLKAATLPRTAKPDIRRRFPDTEATSAVSRAAAEVVERSVIYANDVGEVSDPISAAVDDVLLPGRGTCWVSYEPEIEGDEGYGAESDDVAANAGGGVDGPLAGGEAAKPNLLGAVGDGGGFNSGGSELYSGATPRITAQKLTLDYVYWEDFTHGKARKWCDVPWVARRHVLRKDQFQSKFPKAKADIKLTYKLEDASGDSDDGTEYVEVWEIWDKPSRRRLYIGRGYAGVLQSDDDPYGLTGLFPCPKPLTSVTTTDRLTPSPEFLQYQDQANELDTIATRISALLKQLQFKGIYDGSLGGDKSPISDVSKADDGEFLAYEGWQALKEKGGIEAAFGFWPIERIPPIIQMLTDRASRLTQQIYEVTGISDIIRGSTDPNETKGAQQLKAQFGSMRMQARQKDVQRFVRDCYRMEAEIIAEHFTEETLREITGLDFAPVGQGAPALQPQTPPLPARDGMQPQSMPGGPIGGSMAGASPMAPPMPGAMPPMGQAGVPGELPMNGGPTQQAAAKPTWEGVMRILRSDKMRGYRIDIETDETVLEDAEAEKSSRIEFMGAVNDMLEKAYIAAMQAPMMLPLIRETFMFGIRSFKVGRALEQSAEDAFDQLIKSPPQQPAQEQPKPTGPDPEIERAKIAAQQQTDQGRLAIEKQKADADAADKLARFGLEKQKTEHDIAMSQRQFGLSVAGQNKQIMDEANQEMASAQPNAQPGTSPIEMMMAGIQQLAAVVAQGNQQIATTQAQQTEQLSSMVQAMSAPKRVIRNPSTGRVEGVETVTIQ